MIKPNIQPNTPINADVTQIIRAIKPKSNNVAIPNLYHTI